MGNDESRFELLPQSITTPRLTLRLWQPDDLPLMRRAVQTSVEHLRPWMIWIQDEPVSDRDRLALIELWSDEHRSGLGTVMAALLTGTDTVVGGTGFPRRTDPTELEIGYWVHPDHLRRGYATEMTVGLTHAAFTMDGVERVHLHHDRANTASRGIPTALGFTFDGETVDGSDAPGEEGVSCAWSMTRADWLTRHPENEASLGN